MLRISVQRPPAAITQLRVLEYAHLPDRLPFMGTSTYVTHADGPFGPLDRVPRLALCQDLAGVQLIFCDGRWRPVASVSHPNIPKAKRAAERAYPGSMRLWKPSQYSVADFQRHQQRQWAPYSCLFCGKAPPEFGPGVSLFKAKRGRICSTCVREFAADLPKSEP